MAKDKIPSDSAKWLARQVHSMDFPLEEILKGTELSLSWINDENALITPAQYLAIVGNALDITGDAALGLNIGPKQYLGDLGFLGYAVLSSPTLREANEAALQFWELNGSLVTLSCFEEPDYGTWKIFPAFPMQDLRLWVYAVDELLSTFHKAACFLSNREIRYAEIWLSFPDPGHGSLYRELFQCPVSFGREVDLFRIASGLSGQTTFTGHPGMALVCRQQCRELQAKLEGKDELITAIRDVIISSMGRLPHLAAVAGTLAMSPRTLRRRLQERSMTYRHILDEVRIELAKEYVGTTSLSVDQIACRIGFTEAATFRRAFKKWTGMNIKEFRKNKGEKKTGVDPSQLPR